MAERRHKGVEKLLEEGKISEAEAQKVDSYFKAAAKGKKKGSPTNELTKAVLKYVRSQPASFAWRVNSTGVVRNGKYTYSGATSGVPDVEACVKGKYVGFEIKYGKDKMRESQILFKQRIEEAEGIYVIVKRIEDVIEWYKNYT